MFLSSRRVLGNNKHISDSRQQRRSGPSAPLFGVLSLEAQLMSGKDR
jgi:hypothetical protein